MDEGTKTLIFITFIIALVAISAYSYLSTRPNLEQEEFKFRQREEPPIILEQEDNSLNTWVGGKESFENQT